MCACVNLLTCRGFMTFNVIGRYNISGNTGLSVSKTDKYIVLLKAYHFTSANNLTEESHKGFCLKCLHPDGLRLYRSVVCV